ADADRRRQIAMLPAAVAAARGLWHRGLAADRADARPGRGAGRGRRQCGGAELDAVTTGGERGRAAIDRGRSRLALFRAGAAVDAPLPVPAGAGQHRAVCDRLSTLRLAMGARLPPRIYPA